MKIIYKRYNGSLQCQDCLEVEGANPPITLKQEDDYGWKVNIGDEKVKKFKTLKVAKHYVKTRIKNGDFL